MGTELYWVMLKEAPSDMGPDGNNLRAWLISEVQQAKVGRHLDFTMQTAWNWNPDGRKMWVDRVDGEDEVQKTTESTKSRQHFFLWKQRLRSEKGILLYLVSLTWRRSLCKRIQKGYHVYMGSVYQASEKNSDYKK